MKKLARKFGEISAQFAKIHAGALVPSILRLKMRRGVPRYARQRRLRFASANAFYAPSAHDLFRADAQRLRVKEAIDAPFRYSAAAEWAQLAQSTRDWYKTQADEHKEKARARHGKAYLARRSGKQRRFDIKGKKA